MSVLDRCGFADAWVLTGLKNSCSSDGAPGFFYVTCDGSPKVFARCSSHRILGSVTGSEVRQVSWEEAVVAEVLLS